MLFGIVAAVSSSLFMALMIVADKLMIRDCYGDSKISAWFVSSIAGSTLGLFLTLITWIALATVSETGTFMMIVEASLDLFLWSGVLILISGIFAVQLLYYYFSCFTEDAHIATISSWIAATPIIIFTTSVALSMATNKIFDTTYGNSTSFNTGFVLSITLATASLIAFSLITNTASKSTGKRYTLSLFLMIACNVIYILLLESTLQFDTKKYGHTLYILALLPFFWIGFAAGIRVIFIKVNRQEIKKTWKKSIKTFLYVIILVEVVGMLVFYFEYFGLSKLNASYVTLIVGGHVVLVYLVDLILLDKRIVPLKNRIAEFVLISTAVAGITIASFYI